VVNVGVRDSTYVLDGLLYHESDLRIEEHYTDTAGFTDHVFALMHLLGFRFAPRIRDLGDTKLYIPKGEAAYDALKPMIGGTLNIKHVRAHWDEILRLATSIKQGTVTASLMLRKLGSYPRQNGLAVALRELGRIERTLFILDWLQSVELRRRVHAGLNKGEARNALARAVFFNRLGEIRDRSFEQQRYRASGLNLVTAAIVLWNTVYLERARMRCVATAMPSMTAVAVPVAAGLGAHQPDRRLPLAQQRQDRRGQVQAAATAATGLACFIFRFLRRPREGSRSQVGDVGAKRHQLAMRHVDHAHQAKHDGQSDGHQQQDGEQAYAVEHLHHNNFGTHRSYSLGKGLGSIGFGDSQTMSNWPSGIARPTRTFFQTCWLVACTRTRPSGASSSMLAAASRTFSGSKLFATVAARAQRCTLL
jgi:hypothetical protein